ncbi:MAG: hypothetical protein LC637_10915 [Xanthomonadaceae bacterium]|nr:hypothetical protein [Xanthomonadaceae bacterium]
MPAVIPGDQLETFRIEKSAQANDHPVELNADRLFNALSSLKMEKQTEGLFRRNRSVNQRPVFTEQKLERLVPGLIAEFNQADADEDIAVAVSQIRRDATVGFTNSSKSTFFRTFHRNGDLHLIFGSIEVDPTLEQGRSRHRVAAGPNELDLDRQVGLKTEIGSRRRQSKSDWNPILPAGARFAEPSRTDWIVLDLAHFSAAPPSPAAGLTQPRPATQQSVEPSRPASHDDRGRATPDFSAEPRSPAAAPAQPSAPPTEVPSREQQLEQQLRQLKQLYDQGLIDEPLYKEKMRELVDRLLDTQGE